MIPIPFRNEPRGIETAYSGVRQLSPFDTFWLTDEWKYHFQPLNSIIFDISNSLSTSYQIPQSAAGGVLKGIGIGFNNPTMWQQGYWQLTINSATSFIWNHSFIGFADIGSLKNMDKITIPLTPGSIISLDWTTQYGLIDQISLDGAIGRIKGWYW